MYIVFVIWLAANFFFQSLEGSLPQRWDGRGWKSKSCSLGLSNIWSIYQDLGCNDRGQCSGWIQWSNIQSQVIFKWFPRRKRTSRSVVLFSSSSCSYHLFFILLSLFFLWKDFLSLSLSFRSSCKTVIVCLPFLYCLVSCVDINIMLGLYFYPIVLSFLCRDDNLLSFPLSLFPANPYPLSSPSLSSSSWRQRQRQQQH